MANHYAVGVDVANPPPWLQAAAPTTGWRYLSIGVCDLCERQVRPVWQTTRYGYCYCEACIISTTLLLGESAIV